MKPTIEDRLAAVDSRLAKLFARLQQHNILPEVVAITEEHSAIVKEFVRETQAKVKQLGRKLESRQSVIHARLDQVEAAHNDPDNNPDTEWQERRA